MFKKIIPIIILILALVGLGYYFQKPATKKSSSKIKTANSSVSNTEDKNLITITIAINDGVKTLRNVFKIEDQSTVLQLMEQAKKSGKITFTTKQYSFGEMIDSINNVKADDVAKKYWTLYVNDQMATEGVSTQKVKANDSIEWRYQSL